MAQAPKPESGVGSDSPPLEQAHFESNALTSPPSPSAHEKDNCSDSEALDPSHPRNWPNRRKWIVTGFSSFMTFMIGLNALSVSAAAGEINAEFNISDASFPNSYWSVTAWNGGAIIGPVLGLPIMENFGLRKAYLVSLTPSSCTHACLMSKPGAQRLITYVYRHTDLLRPFYSLCDTASRRAELRNPVSLTLLRGWLWRHSTKRGSQCRRRHMG